MNNPLLAIVGPTGSGKSSIAHRLALEFNGSIVCADSQTLRSGLDIGTAKPSSQDRQEIDYYGLDLIEPYDAFTAANFKKIAQTAIDNIASEGKLPILVGGTGLYVDSVLYDYSFRPPESKSHYNRSDLEALDIEQLQYIIKQKLYPMPTNDKNKRHLIRVIEAGGVPDKKNNLRPETLVLGIGMPSELLQSRISARVKVMLESGLVAECQRILSTYGAPPDGWNVLGYTQIFDALKTSSSPDESKLEQDIAHAHWKYARRQKTWLKRSDDIKWIQNYSEATDLLNNFMRV